jgi:hypothetical protein
MICSHRGYDGCQAVISQSGHALGLWYLQFVILCSQVTQVAKLSNYMIKRKQG